MRVLVTGHLGYIGTVLVPLLQREEFEPVGLDTDLYRGCTFGDPGAIADVPSLDRDVRAVTASDLEGIDAVLHLAALSNDPLGNLDAGLTEAVNRDATIRLAEAAREAGVSRFVFSSSCSNYGAGGEDLLLEDAALNPVTPYGCSKVDAEAALVKMADERFCTVSLRNATAYGMSPRLRFDLVVNNLVGWALTTGQVLLQSDGSAWRPLVHVEDIARAFIAVLRALLEQVHGEVFNVGSTKENYQIRDVATIVAEVVPGCAVKFATGASPDRRCYRVGCDKIRNAIGFETTWDVRRGAEEVHDACRDANLTAEQFQGSSYMRVARIQELLARGELGRDLRWTSRQPTTARD